ncbi:OmpH family outer membrane protein [Rhodoferax sp. 4810]|nr:OmpH family outer membrane protein [Rhodoferax jenense]
MKRLITSVCVTLSILLSLAAVNNAAAAELGSVDMARVLKESQLGKDAEARLEARFSEKTKPFAEEEQEIRGLQQALARDKPLMSQAQAEKKEAEIQTRIKKFEKDFAALQRELMQAQQEEGRKILVPARDAVGIVAKKKKLLAVYESSQSNMLYLSSQIDITDAVIAQINGSAKTKSKSTD